MEALSENEGADIEPVSKHPAAIDGYDQAPGPPMHGRTPCHSQWPDGFETTSSINKFSRPRKKIESEFICHRLRPFDARIDQIIFTRVLS